MRKDTIDLATSVVDPKLYPFQEILDLDPDPTWFLTKEEKEKNLKENAAKILILRKRFGKPTCAIFCTVKWTITPGYLADFMQF